jgi:hypothetical protein
VWPEYNRHGDVVNLWWGHLAEELPEYQFVLIDDDDPETVVAEGHTGPFAWNGRDGSLPGSFDSLLEMIFRQNTAGTVPTALSALAAETPRDGRRRGLAIEILQAMRTIAARHGLRHLVAPVRPSAKDRYPLVPIERYATWRRADGQLLDPWMRVHERLGARVGPAMPQSLLITGSVADWTSWTGLEYPDPGAYVFPEGLALLEIDLGRDRGTYWEPNVWMIHPDVDRGSS